MGDTCKVVGAEDAIKDWTNTNVKGEKDKKYISKKKLGLHTVLCFVVYSTQWKRNEPNENSKQF